jgi:hypothetical protein
MKLAFKLEDYEGRNWWVFPDHITAIVDSKATDADDNPLWEIYTVNNRITINVHPEKIFNKFIDLGHY